MAKIHPASQPWRLGRKLAFYRNRAGLTQARLAESIDRDEATVSRYETGKKLPPLDTLFSIAAQLRVPIAELFSEEIPPPSDEGQRCLAILESLPSDERRIVLDVLEALAGSLRKNRGQEKFGRKDGTEFLGSAE